MSEHGYNITCHINQTYVRTDLLEQEKTDSFSLRGKPRGKSGVYERKQFDI